MYDCEGVISNDANINRIYDKYVQEQMIRALDIATEYQDIVILRLIKVPLIVINAFHASYVPQQSRHHLR